MTKKFARAYTKCTLLGVLLQLMLLHHGKYIGQVVQMVKLMFAFDDHIVNVRIHSIAELDAEHECHHSLLCCSGILQIEGHHFIVVDPSRHGKCRLLHVLIQCNLAPVGIHETQTSVPNCCIHKLVDLGQGEIVLGARIVQIGVVYIDAPLVVLFLYHHCIGEEIGVLNFFSSDLEEPATSSIITSE